MSAIVYLNGEFLPADEAKVSVLDRGFIFGDGIYEVIPVYGGRLFRLEHHLNRLDHSLQGIHLENPLPHSQWRSVFEQLVEKNGGSDHSLYLQITRGVAQRDHAIPLQNEPTLFAMCNPLKSPNLSTYRQGIEAITIEDIRWKHCNIKAIALLPNILLRQQAINAGVSDAIMLRDGEVTEGTAANAFIVKNGCVITPPKSNLLLPGITRDLVVELCQEHKIPVEERAILEEELTEADEVWLTSSTKEILPVTRLNGTLVGKGEAGPMWEQMAGLYRDYKTAVREGRRD